MATSRTVLGFELASERARPQWIHSASYDLGFLCYAWVPLLLIYLSIAPDHAAAQAWLISTAVALQFTHRQYTYWLVYSDKERFQRAPRFWLLTPVLIFAATMLFFFAWPISLRWIVFVPVAVWEMWHVIMQRFGFLRIYAARIKNSLETAGHSKRDKTLLWAMVIFTALAVYKFHHADAENNLMSQNLMRFLNGVIGTHTNAFFAAGAAGLLMTAVIWIRAELKPGLPLETYLPRWNLVFSTALLLLVFVWKGPLLGFICMTFTHPIEYLAFVHQYEKRKFSQLPSNRIKIWKNPYLSLSVIGLSQLILFYFIFWRPDPAVIFPIFYTSGTGVIHFLFDGMIWKVRENKFRRVFFR